MTTSKLITTKLGLGPNAHTPTDDDDDNNNQQQQQQQIIAIYQTMMVVVILPTGWKHHGNYGMLQAGC